MLLQLTGWVCGAFAAREADGRWRRLRYWWQSLKSIGFPSLSTAFIPALPYLQLGTDCYCLRPDLSPFLSILCFYIKVFQTKKRQPPVPNLDEQNHCSSTPIVCSLKHDKFIWDQADLCSLRNKNSEKCHDYQNWTTLKGAYWASKFYYITGLCDISENSKVIFFQVFHFELYFHFHNHESS